MVGGIVVGGMVVNGIVEGCMLGGMHGGGMRTTTKKVEKIWSSFWTVFWVAVTVGGRHSGRRETRRDKTRPENFPVPSERPVGSSGKRNRMATVVPLLSFFILRLCKILFISVLFYVEYE